MQDLKKIKEELINQLYNIAKESLNEESTRRYKYLVNQKDVTVQPWWKWAWGDWGI